MKLAYTLEGKFFVNPGSCTGAFNTDWPIVFDVEDSDEAVTSEVEKTPKESGAGQEDDAAKGEPAEKEQSETDVADVSAVDENKLKAESQFKEDEVNISDLDINGSNSPSFCLLDIQGTTCTLYIYLYVDGEVKVDKVVYEKE